MTEATALDAAACVTSWIVGHYRTRDFKDIDACASLLRDLGGLHARQGSTVRFRMRRRGLTRSQVNEAWDAARFVDFGHARLPADLLGEFFSDAELAVLADLIAAGPQRASELLERDIWGYSQRQIRPTSARPEGGRVTPRSVRGRHEQASKLVRGIAALAARKHPCEDLRRWSRAPELAIPRVTPVKTDRSAPDLDLVRRVAHPLDQDIDQRLGARDGDKLAAIRRLTTVQLWHAHVWRDLRRLLLLSLGATIGARIAALALLRASDFDPEHRFPDGTVAPALALRPGKTVHLEQLRWKGLADREAALVQAHVLLTERLYREREPRPNTSWRTARPPRTMPAEWFLFTGSIARPDRDPNPQGLSSILSGGTRTDALLPLELQPTDRPAKAGYSAHRLRSFCEQAMKQGLEGELELRGIRHISATAIVNAVLDHQVGEDPYGYSDLATEEGRENWSRIAAQASSALLWTDTGARRVPDLEAYAAALARVEELESQLDRVERAISDARRRAVSSADVANALVARLLGAIDQARRLERSLDEARERLERFEHDRATWKVVVPGAPVTDAERNPDEALQQVRKSVVAATPQGLRRIDDEPGGEARDVA